MPRDFGSTASAMSRSSAWALAGCLGRRAVVALVASHCSGPGVARSGTWTFTDSGRGPQEFYPIIEENDAVDPREFPASFSLS
jgi:hypothetical protein